MSSAKNDRQNGFTLVEILVVTAIIGILIGLILGISGFAAKKSDESKTKAQMQVIGNALEEYRVLYGSYPTNLVVLTNATSKLSVEFKNIPSTDPWGRPYVYEQTSRYAYSLRSLGSKDSGVDKDTDDIVSGTF